MKKLGFLFCVVIIIASCSSSNNKAKKNKSAIDYANTITANELKDQDIYI